MTEILVDRGLLTDPGPGESDEHDAIDPRQLRTRAILKVQDGCDNPCSYCVVTLARGAGHLFARRCGSTRGPLPCHNES